MGGGLRRTALGPRDPVLLWRLLAQHTGRVPEAGKPLSRGPLGKWLRALGRLGGEQAEGLPGAEGRGRSSVFLSDRGGFGA